jgi:hypothetical protein
MLQPLLVQSLEHSMSELWLNNMEYQLFFTLITVRKNFFLGLMGLFRRLNVTSKSTESHYSLLT